MPEESGKYLRAWCESTSCPRQVDVTIPIPVVAPGLIGIPQGLHCKGCGRPVRTERTDA
jgi:hypothetical protein